MKKLIILLSCAVLVACSGVQSLNIDTNKTHTDYSQESGTNINYGGMNASANISIKHNSSSAK